MNSTPTRCLVATLVVATLAARADSPSAASFALLIGVNRSVDAELAPLRYADDDAARFQELFRLLGAQTWLLARLDENTRRVHPQAAAEAMAPTDAELDAIVAKVASALEQAHARGVRTTLYVVYAGHGNVRDGEGSLALEDARLNVAALRARIFDRLPAGQTHFIADACYSSFLAAARGPGGSRRPVQGFAASAGLGDVGLLLSTTSARESHEWEGFQAGVFSHELRSGLLGAADADGDGQVSYRELAAFVERANAAIPNERYRPDVHARPPKGGEVLVELRRGLERHLELDPTKGAHYVLEDARGVRLADVHSGSGQATRLIRPAVGGALYLTEVDSGREFALPSEPATVRLASLSPTSPRAASRGAAHDAFSLTFALPFDATVVSQYRARELPDAPAGGRAWARTSAWVSGAAGFAALAGGVTLWVLAADTRAAVTATQPQSSVAAANQRIAALNTAGVALDVTAGVALTAAVVLWLWFAPESPATLAVAPWRDGVGAVGIWRF